MDFWGKIRVFWGFLGCFGALCDTACPSPRIVVTIPPLGFIVSAVVGDLGTITVLLSGDASPHVQTLTPRHQRVLKNADLLFWVGPGYESFLSKVIIDPDLPHKNVLTAGAVLLPKRYSVRGGGMCCHHGDDHGHNHGDHTDPDFDNHVWLDPQNGAALADAVCDRLIKIDPKNTAIYRTNRDVFKGKIADLHQKLTPILTPVRGKPFYVFHDGYQYFEKAYGLSGLGALTVSPHIPLSLKRLRDVRAEIQGKKVKALFGEKQFNGTAVSDLAASLYVRFGILDPFGGDLPIKSDSYIVLLNRLADSFEKTLGNG